TAEYNQRITHRDKSSIKTPLYLGFYKRPAEARSLTKKNYPNTAWHVGAFSADPEARTVTPQCGDPAKMKWMFKEDHSLEHRCVESAKIRNKYPDRVPDVLPDLMALSRGVHAALGYCPSGSYQNLQIQATMKNLPKEPLKLPGGSSDRDSAEFQLRVFYTEHVTPAVSLDSPHSLSFHPEIETDLKKKTTSAVLLFTGGFLFGLQVIVEKVSGSQIVDIDKRKYLVPSDITVAQFMWIIRKRIQLPSEKAIFLFVDKTVPQSSLTMGQLYDKEKDEDGFLYVAYSGENTFG
ncbi:hypothetical protein CCH79_00010173, partial [Gambusia affinis]